MKADTLFFAAGRQLPRTALRRMLSVSLSGLSVGLCLHRVDGSRRPTDRQPALSIPAEELDALIELLLGSRSSPSGPWLTVTFDDGYADAAAYIAERSRVYPQVEWIFFVCPTKTESRAGFRWDLDEAEEGEGARFQEQMDVARENARPELQRLSADHRFKLATVEECRALQGLPNVFLGNHTNNHFRQTSLTPEQASEEARASTRDFERLFGPQRHFAFPFGTPGYEFDAKHVELVRAASPGTQVWSTERRPYRPEERTPGAVLPRFPINGTLTHRELAAWMAARTVVYLARGTSHAFS